MNRLVLKPFSSIFPHVYKTKLNPNRSLNYKYKHKWIV